VGAAVWIGCAAWTLRAAHAETPPSTNTTLLTRDIGAACQATWTSRPAAPVVVMLISPRMLYSLLEWPRMRSGALVAGFDVVTWKAPGVSAQEWAQAIQAARWTPAQSDLVSDVPAACAAWLQRVNHFPFSTVVLGRHAHEWPIWGVLTDEAWAVSLALRLDALRDASIRNNMKSP
jgi:hypothetical protein